MNVIKLFFLFILLSLDVAYCRLGDTEEQAIVQRPAAIAIGRTQLEGGGVLLIIEDKDTEYTAGFLNGRCEVEVYRNLDDSKLKESFILGELKAVQPTLGTNPVVRSTIAWLRCPRMESFFQNGLLQNTR